MSLGRRLGSLGFAKSSDREPAAGVQTNCRMNKFK